MGFSACPSPCALYNNYSRDCSFALSSHRTGHDGIFSVPTCILPFLYQVTQCPSRSVLTPIQHTPCAAAILSCCHTYSAWGDPPAWMTSPVGGRRTAESSRAARWKLPEAAAFSPDAWLTPELSSPLLPGLMPSFPARCQQAGC